MNAKNLIAAAVVFVSTATAFAADLPAAPAAEVAKVTSSGARSGASGAGATASGPNLNLNLNLPALGAASDTAREASKAEAVESVKHYRTALAVQLDQYRN